MYHLEDLLKLRTHREKLAFNRIIKARMKLREARNTLKEKNEELSSFIQWRRNEEKRLFKEIKGKYHKIDQLDYYSQLFEALRIEHEKLKDKLYKAEQRVKKAEVEVDKENEIYVKRHREKKKMEEHKKNWLQTKIVTDQRQEENEIDELGSMRFNILNTKN